MYPKYLNLEKQKDFLSCVFQKKYMLKTKNNYMPVGSEKNN